MQSCDELWQWIESFIKKGQRGDAELRFRQFQALCTELGSPQNRFLSVHVAGSKGKGQTASYIAHGLAACGYRVGLYSSPHIHSYSERIQVLEQKKTRRPGRQALGRKYYSAGFSLDSVMESDSDIESRDISEILLSEGKHLRESLSKHEGRGYPPNFFAVLTLLGYFSFSALECDWVVLETGIGGRLCPTNAVLPELSVLTPIELEHTDVLGKSLALIAAEKGGIIKSEKPCISSAQVPEVRSVLKKICAERRSEIHFVDEILKENLETGADDSLLGAFQVEQKLVLSMRSLGQQTLHLHGSSSTQRENLALALLAMHILKLDIPEAIRGLESSRVPGRFAAFWQPEKNCLLLFDGAHTPSSCRRLLSDIKQYSTAAGGDKLRMCLLFGAVQGKNFAEMASVLAEAFDEILLTRAGIFKENDLPALKQAFEQAQANLLPEMADPREALGCLLQRDADLIVVCGSFYLLGELLPKLELT